MELFLVVAMTPSAAVSDFDDPRYCQFVPFNFLLSLGVPNLHGVLVLVNSYKFIASVFVTGNNCSRVSLTPVINLSPVTTKPVITENQ
jgi:hypothetical protein